MKNIGKDTKRKRNFQIDRCLQSALQYLEKGIKEEEKTWKATQYKSLNYSEGLGRLDVP